MIYSLEQSMSDFCQDVAFQDTSVKACHTSDW